MNDSSLNWPDGIRAVYEGVQAQPAVRAHPIALTDAALQTGDGAGGGLPGVTVGAAEPIALAAVPPAVWQAELDRQDRVLRGAAEAMHLLLTTPRFVPALSRAFEALGKAIGVDAIALFENHRDPGTGALLTSRRYAWTHDAARGRRDAPPLRSVSYADTLRRWADLLGRGEVIAGPVRDFPAPERALLQAQGVVSTLVAPVFVGGAFWGFVAFDDRAEPRAWSEGVRAMLAAVGGSIGAAYERERAARAHREDETRTKQLALVAAHTSTGVIVTGLDRLVAWVNPAFERMSGYASEEVLGQPLGPFLNGPETELAALMAMESAYRRREAFDVEAWNHRKDGATYRARIEGRPLADDAGAFCGYMAVLTDVTKQRRATEALERALERERELGEMKTRFVAMASHELRTPLAAIQSSAELVERFALRGDPEKVSKHLGRVRANVQEMTELLDDVLLMGRADGGRLAFDPQPIELVSWVHEVAEQVRLGVGARHHLALAVPEDPVPAVADRKLLRFALGNLLSNAVKYSEPGSAVDVRLEVEAPGPERTGEPGTIRLAVRDHGIGIPAADLPRLFEPFHRAANVGTRRGTGLGLAIAHRAADAHGGRITVESAPGAGSTFTLHLPLVQP